MANPTGKSGPRDKPYRDALRRAIARAEQSQSPHSLDKIAEKHLAQAANGDIGAMKELADRLDGRVPQAIGGTDELPAIKGISWLSDQTALSASTIIQDSNSSTSTSESSDGLASWPTDGQAKQ